MPRPLLVSFVCNMYRYTIPLYLMDASRVNRLQLAVTKIKNIFQPGGVTYGKLLRQISKQYE